MGLSCPGLGFSLLDLALCLSIASVSLVFVEPSVFSNV